MAWIMQIGSETGSRRIEEQGAWAKDVFPAAHERLKQAAAAIEPGTPAQPFIDALTELVQAGRHRQLRRPVPLGGDPGAALPAAPVRPRPHHRAATTARERLLVSGHKARAVALRCGPVVSALKHNEEKSLVWSNRSRMDRRLIRTAVFGSPNSDEPALCPETPEELDVFRREHENVTIWCGTMFEGGCGRQLMTRRCTDKICHFAHYGSGGEGQRCGRKERGKDSANHLFTKAHLASWLRARDAAAEFSYPEPRGSAVVVRLEDGRTLLVHLDRNRPVDWDSEAWETILGPGVGMAPSLLAQRGYVHRIRFDDRPGGGRTMQFGTQIPGEGTTWGSLDDVVLTSENLLTATKPVVLPAPVADTQQVITRAERAIVTVASSTAGTVPGARQSDHVRQVLLRFDIALRDHPSRVSSATETVRQLLEAGQIPADDARLRIALGRGERWLQERARRRRAVVERLKEQPAPELYWRPLTW
ncbi:hypothetical protein ACFVH9_36815 [Streptomyces hirsutus]|uniref:hypothetical protein n=1 Tax=Streptomyces hirsutus TaxID=35620 RepID=UPI003639A78A